MVNGIFVHMNDTYYIEVLNPPHNVKYKITRDCYYKLEQLLSK